MDETLFLLVLVGFSAGLMDAAVGGGGLLQLPGVFSLLPNVNIPAVLGINKFASCCGTGVATTQFIRKVKMPWKMLLPAAALAFVGSYIGAKLTAFVPMQYMKPLIFVIMVLMFIYTFTKKDLGQIVRQQELTPKEYRLGLFFGLLIGFYDGLLGPGTGSLLAFVFVRFFAFDFLQASASAKVLNLTTNLAALCFFIPSGHIIWHFAMPLALANLCGGFVGARLAIWGGTKFLRLGFMLILIILIGRFGYDIVKTTI